MTEEQKAKLQTYYLYDLRVLKSTPDMIQADTNYEYSCPKTYYFTAFKDTETGQKIVTPNDIKTRLIDGGDPDYHTVNEIIFKIQDGFLIDEFRDNSGLVRRELIPLQYVTNIQIGRHKPLS